MESGDFLSHRIDLTMLQRIKKLAWNGISRFGLYPLLTAYRHARGREPEHLLESSLAGRFTRIYEDGIWLNARGSGSRSGLGSDPRNAAIVQQRLPEILGTLGTSTLLDIGCGDFGWMKDVDLPCQYIGIDIVRPLIDANQTRYGLPARSFQTLDATVDHLPCADTLLCREVMFHLSFRDVWLLIGNFRRSGARFLIATTDASVRFNADIVSGDFRPLNLQAGPFGFSDPVFSIPDDQVSSNRRLGVWKISDLP